MADEAKRGGEQARGDSGRERVRAMAADLFIRSISSRSGPGGWTLEAHAAHCYEAALAFEKVSQDPEAAVEQYRQAVTGE